MSEKKVWVVGHKNPDTDSICAAIAYAALKNQLDDGKKYEAKRAGALNEETKYVLDRFHVSVPELVTDAGVQVKDIEIRRTNGVNSHISMKKAWELMKTLNVVSLPITNKENKLEGMIVTGDIATSYMDVLDNTTLSTARTQYKNIVETINGTLISGNEHGYFVRGKVVIPTGNTAAMVESIAEDDLVILGNREDSISCALEENCSCMIVCNGTIIAEDIIRKAEKRDIVLISTPFDTFTVARLINQSIPIKHFMKRDNLITFEMDDYVDNVKEVMAKVRHRDFPVLDNNDNYVGMVSRRNLLNLQRKQLILVDHNEKTQAIDNVEESEILEIIDHHRLGSLETISPVLFRNQPLGSTSTIIALLYEENHIEITPQIAGILTAAIVSDTLMFRSPTCTPTDRTVAERLAVIAEIDIEQMAKEMFQAGSNFKTKSTEEIFYQDFKTFKSGEIDFGVAQISAMSDVELNDVRESLRVFMPLVMGERKLDMVFVMLTNILDEKTELLCEGKNASEIAKNAFRAATKEDSLLLKGVVSRKKQFIPTFMNALQIAEEK